MGLVVEDLDEFAADGLALGFGIGDAGEFAEESAAGVDGDEVEAELGAQVFLHLEELVLAQDAVVDEDAGEAVADGAMDEHGGDGGIDSAGERADGVAVADLFANGGDGGFDEVLRVSSRAWRCRA